MFNYNVLWILTYYIVIWILAVPIHAAESQNTTIVCENGGTLSHNDTGEIYCQCSTNYTGMFCQDTIHHKDAVNCNYCGDLLFDVLFTNYKNQVRPAMHAENVTNILVNFTIITLSDIIEKEQEMNIMGFFELEWYDERLSWNPDHYGGVKTLTVQALEVWLPDVIISNTAVAFYSYTYKRDFLVTIHHTGLIYWEFGGVILTSCDLQMTQYPFDIQTCSIDLETWRYNVKEVELFYSRIRIMDTVYGNALWDLMTYKGNKSLIYSSRYSRVSIIFTWKRKDLYYYMNIIIPTILMILVTLGVYWIPTESGEKVSLAVTLLLAFSVFLIIIMDNTPVNSAQVPIITAFVLLVMIITTAALLMSIVITYMHGKAAETCPVPKWLEFICFDCLAKLLCMKSILPHKGQTLLPINGQLAKIGDSSVKTGDVELQCDDSLCKKETEQNLQDTNAQLKEISKKLGQMLRYVEDKEESDNIQTEWIIVGRIVDRFCFWITLIVIVIFVPLLFTNIL